MLGVNDTSTIVGHFVSSPTEREKNEEIVEEIKVGDRGERKMNASEEKKTKKHPSSNLTSSKDSRPCPTVSKSQFDALVT